MGARLAKLRQQLRDLVNERRSLGGPLPAEAVEWGVEMERHAWRGRSAVITFDPLNVAIDVPTTVTVRATDEQYGQEVHEGVIHVDGQRVGTLYQPFTTIFRQTTVSEYSEAESRDRGYPVWLDVDKNPVVTVKFHDYPDVDVPIQFHLPVMRVSVSPAVFPAKKATTLTVTAVDALTGQPIAGDVLCNGKIEQTNTPFTCKVDVASPLPVTVVAHHAAYGTKTFNAEVYHPELVLSQTHASIPIHTTTAVRVHAADKRLNVARGGKLFIDGTYAGNAFDTINLTSTSYTTLTGYLQPFDSIYDPQPFSFTISPSPECVSLATQIADLEAQIKTLQSQASTLNPDYPLHQDLLAEIQADIYAARDQINTLKAQRASIGCDSTTVGDTTTVHDPVVSEF